MAIDKKTHSSFLKAIEYFPKWMQIRRRPFKSNSGKLLLSIIEEIQNIYEEVNNYNKRFFLVEYAGKEDEIASHVYRANIGISNDIIDLHIDIPITYSLKEFYEEKDLAYYDNGNLYLKEENVYEQVLRYTINNFNYSTNLIKEPIWNIFDEFAWFAGIERFEDETNSSLVNRTYDAFRTKDDENNHILFDDDSIYDAYKHRFNSTEIGLKYLIKNIISASGHIPFKDIKIESLNEENLFKEYLDGTIYDYISEINKDIAKEKVWDESLWEHSFIKLNHAPHIWDQPVYMYQQGIGYFDSLKVYNSSEIELSDSTDVDIYEQVKSREAAAQYIMKTDRKIPITLTLKKHSTELKALDFDYRAYAFPMREVKPKEIEFSFFKDKNLRKEIYLEEIIDPTQVYDQGITLEDAGILRNNTSQDIKYTLEFQPKYINGNILIDNIFVDDVDQLDPYYNDEWFIKNKYLSYIDNYFYGTKLSDFHKSSFIKNAEEGVILDRRNSSSGTLSVSLTPDMLNKTIFYELSDKKTSILDREDIFKENTYRYDEEKNILVADTNKKASLFFTSYLSDFKVSIAKLTYEEDIGSCVIRIKDAETNTLIARKELNADTMETEFSWSTQIPKNVTVSVTKIGERGFVLTELSVSANNIEFFVDGVKLNPVLGDYTIPTSGEVLTIKLSSYLGISAPILKYVSIAGGHASFKFFKKDIIVPANSSKRLRIKGSDYKLNLYYNDQLLSSDYEPVTKYSGKGRLFLTVNKKDIKKSTPPIKEETFVGKALSYIDIDGPIKKINIEYTNPKEFLYKKTLEDIFKTMGISEERNRYYTDAQGNLVKISSAGYDTVLIKDINLPKDFNILDIKTHSGIDSYFISDRSHRFNSHDSSSVNYIYEVKFSHKDNSSSVAHKQFKTIKYQVVTPLDKALFSPKLNSSEVYRLTVDTHDGHPFYRYQNYGSTVVKDFSIIGAKVNRPTADILIIKDGGDIREQEYSLSLIKDLKSYLFSTELTLDDKIEDYILAEYTINTPDYLSIEYKESTHKETVVMNEEGVAKLKYANVLKSGFKIKNGDDVIPEDNYILYKEEGIVLILDASKLKSLELKVEYTYKKPYKIFFNNLDILYDKIEHHQDAYALKLLETVKNVHDKETKQLSQSYQNKLIAAIPKDELYSAVTTETTVTAFKKDFTDKIVVKSGYYYEEGKEYYYPGNEQVITKKEKHAVKFPNSSKQGSYLLLHMENNNFIPNSSMSNKRLHPLTILNFERDKEFNINSSLGKLSIPTSFNNWSFYDCDSFLDHKDNKYSMRLSFNKESSYSLFKLSDLKQLKKYLSMSFGGDLKFYLAEEVKINDFKLPKLPLLKIFEEIKTKDGYFNINIPKDIDGLYLVIKGKSGFIYEIGSSDSSKPEKTQKNIERLGWKIEQELTNRPIELIYDNINAVTTNVDINDMQYMSYGVTMDYESTLIASADFKRCTLDKALIRHNKIVTLDEPGIVTTEIFNIIPTRFTDEDENHRALIHNILYSVLKINTIETKEFKIKIYGADTYNERFLYISEVENTNFSSLSTEKLKRFLRFEIEIPKNSEISSISLYNIYKEIPNLDLLNIKSLEYYEGTLESRLFYISSRKTVVIESIDADIKGQVFIYIRGLRSSKINSVFGEWKLLELDGLRLKNNIIYSDTTAYQIKVKLIGKESELTLRSIKFKEI